MEKLKVIVSDEYAGKRLDACCALLLNEKHQDHDGLFFSREYLKHVLRDGGVIIDDMFRKPSYKVSTGQVIEITIPEPEEYPIEAENIPLDIIYEDRDVIVVNKPKGMVVHPAPGNYSGTLVNALMYHTKDLSGINGVTRPGIVHRIDKDTTGLLMVAKNDLAHQKLSEQLKAHSIHREYIGLCKGNIKETYGTIDLPIGRHPKERLKRAVVKEGGKKAVTHFHVLEHYRHGFTLASFILETGRTHQIRVHMASLGFPLVGDHLYGGEKGYSFKTEGQCLHAAKLGFEHPRTGAFMDFSAPLPDYFQSIINQKLVRI